MIGFSPAVKAYRAGAPEPGYGRDNLPETPQPQPVPAPQNTSPQPPPFPPNREVREGDLPLRANK